MKKILIAVATHNRKRVTELSLRNLASAALNADIVVWDDCSTEYSVEWLRGLVPNVVQSKQHCGIHALRGIQLWHFLRETTYQRIYLTDTDVIHDPHWQVVAEELLQRHKNPVCLFNTMCHARPMEPRLPGPTLAHERTTCPGVSVYLSREMVECIADRISVDNPGGSFGNWDFELMDHFVKKGYRFTHSMISYLEHFGAGGMHNADYFADTAVLPTHHLKNARDLILPYLISSSENAGERIIRAVTRSPVAARFDYRGFEIQQSPHCYGPFHYFLDTVRPARIVELGTGGGGFAVMLHDILKALGSANEFEIISVDSREQRSYRALVEKGIKQHRLDLNKAETVSFLKNEIQRAGITVVLCDGGNKPRDFGALAGSLKPGDFILAHDYAENGLVFRKDVHDRIWNWLEIQDSDVVEVAREHSLQPFLPLLFSPIAWLCMQKAGGNSK